MRRVCDTENPGFKYYNILNFHLKRLILFPLQPDGIISVRLSSIMIYGQGLKENIYALIGISQLPKRPEVMDMNSWEHSTAVDILSVRI